MKKVISIFAILAMLSGVLGGCGFSSQKETSEPTASREETNTMQTDPAETTETVTEETVQPRNIQWYDVCANSTYNGEGKLSGFLLEVMFLVDSDDHEGFTAENSSGFERGHEPFFVDAYDPDYMYFSFRLPNDSTLEGWHTVTVCFDGISASIEVYLEYLGDYSHLIDTEESVKGLGWNVKEWRVIN